MSRSQNIAILLLIVSGALLSSCDEPVHVGVAEARAAGVNVSAARPSPFYAGPRPIYAATPVVPGLSQAATPVVPGLSQAATPVVPNLSQAATPVAPDPSRTPTPAVRPIPIAATGELVTLTPVPQPQEHGDIVGLKLEHDGAGAVHQITFGQVFIPGQLPRDSGLTARINGREVPAQLDVKTTNPDGSVRFGVVTLTAATPANVMLVQHQRESAASVDLAALSGKYDVTVDLVVHGASGDVPHHFAAGTVLAEALRSGKASFWLQGPLATEARVDVPVEGSLHLTFDIRGYSDGSTFTDVQFNNDIAMQPVGGEVKYDATISRAGKPVFQKAAIDQFQYQTWHREIWSNGDPEVNVVHDVAAMERAGAIWGYDLRNGLPKAALAEEEKQLAQPGYTDVLSTAGITKYMPMTGGRRDIGALPSWDVVWLLTQDAKAGRFALVQSDAAGTPPWHLFSPTTGTYLTADAYPELWIDSRGGNSSGTTGLSQPDNGKAGWTLDPAHEPGLSYLAYMQTGSRYRLDQLNAQATWTVLAVWPPVRQNGLGIVATKGMQLRAGAWGLRELVEAAYINPDSGPLKAYFNRLVATNFDYLLTAAKAAQRGETYGWLEGEYGGHKGGMAPWMQDFMALTVILASEQNVRGAKELLIWQTHFLAGRFLASDKGMSPYDGIAYNMQMWETGPDQPFLTWRELQTAIIANGWSGGGGTFHTGLEDYYRTALSVLGGIITVTGLPEAKQALTWLHAHTPAGVNPNEAGLIVPMVK